MSIESLSAAFLVGLLGGGHCIGMCGGIITALVARAHSSGPSIAPADLRAVVRSSVAAVPMTVRSLSPGLSVALYSGGRLFSYAALGAIVGMLGSLALLADGVLPIQRALYLLASVVLVGMGLYLLGFTQFIAPLERIGAHVWRRIAPWTKRFAPAQSYADALALGLLWGWVPCGLIYSVLASAAASGSPELGAMTMLAFGLGTLPATLSAGLLAKRALAPRARASLRKLAGAVVIGLGLWGMLHVAHSA